MLMRAQDPMSNLATYLGAADPEASTQVVCVDRKRQWSRAKNVRHSVAARSTLHMMKPGKKTG